MYTLSANINDELVVMEVRKLREEVHSCSFTVQQRLKNPILPGNLLHVFTASSIPCNGRSSGWHYTGHSEIQYSWGVQPCSCLWSHSPASYCASNTTLMVKGRMLSLIHMVRRFLVLTTRRFTPNRAFFNCYKTVVLNPYSINTTLRQWWYHRLFMFHSEKVAYGYVIVSLTIPLRNVSAHLLCNIRIKFVWLERCCCPLVSPSACEYKPYPQTHTGDVSCIIGTIYLWLYTLMTTYALVLIWPRVRHAVVAHACTQLRPVYAHGVLP